MNGLQRTEKAREVSAATRRHRKLERMAAELREAGYAVHRHGCEFALDMLCGCKDGA